MTLVARRYELMARPAGLRVRLCSQSRCVELDGQSGTTHGFAHVHSRARSALSGKSPAAADIPALEVRSNQVIVNYR